MGEMRSAGEGPYYWMLGASEGIVSASYQGFLPSCRGYQHESAQMAELPASSDHHPEILGQPHETSFPPHSWNPLCSSVHSQVSSDPGGPRPVPCMSTQYLTEFSQPPQKALSGPMCWLPKVTSDP